MCWLVRGYRFCQPRGRQRVSFRPDLLGLCARGTLELQGAPSAPILPPCRLARCHPWCGAGLIRCRVAAAACSPVAACGLAAVRDLSSTTPPPHDRHTPHLAVGGVFDVPVPDLGRVEQAQRQSLVFSPPAASERRPPGAARSGAVERRVARGAAMPDDRKPGACGRHVRRSDRRRGRRRTRDGDSTDVLKVTLNTLGGSIDRAELEASRILHDPTRHGAARPVAHRYYVAQTGLVPGRAVHGVAHLPPHADDADARHPHLQARAGRADGELRERGVGGVKLVKTYTFVAATMCRRRAQDRQHVECVRWIPALPAAGARRQRPGG